MPDAELFFTEWNARRPGERRSLDRARQLIDLLGGIDVRAPVLTVVGSKGKGTAAAYASAYLAATGARVATITSPAFRTNRERIRVAGEAITTANLDELSVTLARAIRRLPPSGCGYLAPSGLFTIAGMLHASSLGVDFIVLEAGRGGRSDEASLFPPTVAAITPIFEEHLGELGTTVEEIARDKAAIVGPDTRAALSARQRPEVTEVLRAVAPEVEFPGPSSDLRSGLPTDLLGDLLPGGLGAANARLGCLAARRLLDLTAIATGPAPAMLYAPLKSINLPGRLSWHRTGSTRLLLDQSVTRSGAATALELARSRWGRVDHVLLSLSDDKDLDGVIFELTGCAVTFVELNRPHLHFTREIPAHWRRIKEDELPPLSRLGGHVMAIGNLSFVGLIIDLLAVPTERLFTAA